MTETKETGTLSDYLEDEGYGFIANYDGPDYFVHISDVKAGRAPTKADVLEFDVVDTDKGPRAENVEIVEES